MKRCASSTSSTSSSSPQCTAGATAADAIDLDAVTELTYRRLHDEGRRRRADGETAAQRLARIVQTNRDFTAEDYEALLLLDRASSSADAPAESSVSSRSDAGSEDTRVVAMPCDDVLLHDRAEVQLAGAADCAACAVCLDALARGQCVWQLPRCGHVFHARCVARWFDECAAHPVCPICRAPHPCIRVAVPPAAVPKGKDGDDDDEEEEEETAEQSEPARKKRKSTPGHHGMRKHERGRDGHEHRHAPRQQRSAHCCSWVELARGVHASYGPQTTLHAKFRALGQPRAPVAHILPAAPGAPAQSPCAPAPTATTTTATAASAVPDVVIID